MDRQFPPIQFPSVTLQIKFKYVKCLETLNFSEANFASEDSLELSRQQLTQGSTELTGNSSDKKTRDLPEVQTKRKSSCQFESQKRLRSRIKSVSSQMTVYSKKDDVVLLLNLEEGIVIYFVIIPQNRMTQNSDDEYEEIQLIEEEKYFEMIMETKPEFNWQLQDDKNGTVFINKKTQNPFELEI